MRAAIVKPDHLGDLVLASPAIRAISYACAETTLFVSSGSLALARYLFPEISAFRTADFPYLARRPVANLPVGALARELDPFETVFILRDDPVMQALARECKRRTVQVAGSIYAHESWSQKQAVSAVIGDYSRHELFSTRRIAWPSDIRRVGLCIAAGFPTNRWSHNQWFELALRLSEVGVTISLIGGPMEVADLRLLSHLLAPLPHETITGSSDLATFLAAIDQLDLVVAVDGGTAHLCSLRRPVCSLFGPSPWRRYAPFGAENVVITRDLVCSPCLQFSADEVNGCLTRECLAALGSREVALVVQSGGNARLRGFRVERGTSHRHIV
jgi:heptosyltransferase-2